ncbi:MAG: hypothetical protein K2X87_13370 [Gemmataceae bacterium]|nr:hypothetical protein [Gemmataceae bacterium]
MSVPGWVEGVAIVALIGVVGKAVQTAWKAVVRQRMALTADSKEEAVQKAAGAALYLAGQVGMPIPPGFDYRLEASANRLVDNADADTPTLTLTVDLDGWAQAKVEFPNPKAAG